MTVAPVRLSPLVPTGATPRALPGPSTSWAPIAIGRSDGTVVVTLAGRLDASGTAWLDHLLADLVEGQGNQFVAIDLHGVEEADSSVLALLVAFAGRAAGHGGRIVLREPPPATREELDRAAEHDSVEVVLDSWEHPTSRGGRCELPGGVG
jgi:anti-anti-sigma factor